MKFIIPYKTKTRNPNAGKTEFLIPGRVTQYLVFSQEVDLDKKDYRLSYADGDGKYWYLNCKKGDKLVFDEKFEDICRKYLLEINTNQDVQTLHSLTPAGAFLYEYGDFEVECESCGAIFDWKRLVQDWNDDLNGEYFSQCDTICPECGEWYCCEVEFQR